MLDYSTKVKFSPWKFSTLSQWLFDGTCTKQSLNFIELHHQIYFTFVWNVWIATCIKALTSSHTKAKDIVLSFFIQIGLNRSLFCPDKQVQCTQSSSLLHNASPCAFHQTRYISICRTTMKCPTHDVCFRNRIWSYQIAFGVIKARYFTYLTAKYSRFFGLWVANSLLIDEGEGVPRCRRSRQGNFPS
jgi:hypothetical protein